MLGTIVILVPRSIAKSRTVSLTVKQVTLHFLRGTWRQGGGREYFGLEMNPGFAAVIMSLVDLASLSETVKIVVGPSANPVKRLHTSGALTHVDLMSSAMGQRMLPISKFAST